MLTASKKTVSPTDPQLSVWLAGPSDEARFGPAPVSAEHRLPAFAPAGLHRAGLMYASQDASGGSFVAGLEGQITPADGGELLLRIGVPRLLDVPDAEALLEAVLAGAQDVPPELRPAGTLELTRFCVHPADFKAHRWRMAVSLLFRLLNPEMTSLLQRSAGEAELWAAFDRLCSATPARDSGLSSH